MPHGVVPGAVHLVDVEIAGRQAGGPSTHPAAGPVDRLHEAVDLLPTQQPGRVRVGRVGADVDDTDAVVGVEHADAVGRPQVEPGEQRVDRTGVQRVQQQRGQGEVVDVVDALGHPQHRMVPGVHLGEGPQPEPVDLLVQPVHDLQGVLGDEAARARGLGHVADSVQADGAHPVTGQQLQYLPQVLPGARRVQVEVELGGGERGPQQPAAPGDHGRAEGKAGPGPVDRQQVLLPGTVGEDRVVVQEQAGVRGLRTAFQHVPGQGAVHGDVVDDEVAAHVDDPGQPRHIRPRPHARVDLPMVRRVETRVGTVDMGVERQHVHAAEDPAQRAVEQVGQTRQVTCQSVRVGDQLHPIGHTGPLRRRRSPPRGTGPRSSRVQWFGRPGPERAISGTTVGHIFV